MPDYRKVTVEGLSDAPNPTPHKKEVDEAVGASAFGFNVYTADLGELVPWGNHRHPDHEELYDVPGACSPSRTAEGEVRVDADEAFFVPADAPTMDQVADESPAARRRPPPGRSSRSTVRAADR